MVKFDSGLRMWGTADQAIADCEDEAIAQGMTLTNATASFHSFYMRYRVTGTLEPRSPFVRRAQAGLLPAKSLA